MPFKLRLKKSKQYNVVTKTVFVICVELLDNSIVECTLSADSLGYDCLDNVCQRLGLNQPEFFGLRYVSQKSYPRVRWVELDRPLKKQLDKYAQEAYLYLRIMYYVHDVNLLHDEMTRYHYFLQLKSDVMEGRLRCSYEEAIILGGYRLQAEFGDHDPERHTLQYLKEFVLVPKHLVTNEVQLDAVTEAVAEQHAKLIGLPQAVAECWYIVEAQHLDGYGQERFLAKEEPSGEVLVATSLQGILVMRSNTDRVVFYRWDDITNLLNQKRMFGIECQRSEENVQFYFDDPEAARYVWKLAVLQHTFYKPTLLTLQSLQSSVPEDKEGEVALGLAALKIEPSVNTATGGISKGGTGSTTGFDPGPRSSSAMGEIRPENIVQHNGMTGLPHSISSPSLSVVNHSINSTVINPQSAAPSATGSLAASQQNLRSLLPAYRRAPDYETAVRLKYGEEIAKLLVAPAPVQPIVQDLGVQLHQQQHLMMHQMQVMHLYKPPPPYPYSKVGSNSSPDLAMVHNGATFVNTGSVGHLPAAHQAPLEGDQNLSYVNADSRYAPSEQIVRNGEPIYQNIPLRQLNSNPNLSSNFNPPATQDAPPKYKWGIPGLSQRSRNSEKSAITSRNPSPSTALNGDASQTKVRSESLPTTGGSRTGSGPGNVKDHIRQEVESRLADGHLLLEFELMPRRKQGADFTTAAHPDNVHRNQYQDVLPYEENRVRLTPARDNRMGYINASHISAAIGSAQRFYIAAQGPLPSTVADFWQMIWECDVYVIVMLDDVSVSAAGVRSGTTLRSHTSSSSMSGCSSFIYWPQQNSTSLEFGDFKILRQLGNLTTNQAILKLDVTHVPSRKQRSIWHMQYSDWADHGCPKDVNSFLNFLEEVDTVRRHSMADVPLGKNRNTPVLVHCGAGVGRTGVTIACDVLVTCLDHNITVDVPKLITHLRQQRMLMVQTVAQYRFIYALLLNYLDRSRLI